MPQSSWSSSPPSATPLPRCCCCCSLCATTPTPATAVAFRVCLWNRAASCSGVEASSGRLSGRSRMNLRGTQQEGQQGQCGVRADASAVRDKMIVLGQLWRCSRTNL